MQGSGSVVNRRSPNLQTPLMAQPSSSALAHQDPFFSARDDLKGKLDYIQRRHEQFLELLKTTNTASNPQFKELQRGLYRDIEAAENQCKELEKTVAMVEANRQRFKHIDNTELGNRRAFITKIKQTLVRVWNNLEGDYVRGKIAADEREFQKRRGAGGPADARRGAVEAENAAFIDDQRQRAQLLMKGQEEGLQELDNAVTRVGMLANHMNEELLAQGDMLNQLDNEVNTTAESLNFVMNSLQKLLKTKDNCQIYTIVALSVTLVILIILVIYV